MEGSKLRTTQEAAQELGITAGHLRTMIVLGKAHPTEQIGGTWMFSDAEIERLRHRKKTRGPDKKK